MKVIEQGTLWRPGAQRRGTALVGALIAVVLVFGLCMSLVQVSSGVTQRLRHSVDSKLAFELAEAGLAEAYCGLAQAKTGNVGSAAEPAAIGGGVFWVEATELAGGVVELESTGMYGRGRVTLGLAVRRELASLASLGLFSTSSMNVSDGAFVDSYDSEQGAYADQVTAGTNDQALVGSNADVALGVDATVLGDVLHGVGGGVIPATGATVSGSTSERSTPASLPAVEVPPIPLAPPLTLSQIGVLPPGDYGYEALTVARGAVVVVTGPATLSVGDLTVESGAEVVLDNSAGPIDAYVSGDLKLAAGALITMLDDNPEQVTLQLSSGPDAKVHLEADAEFYGHVYAPDANVRLSAGFELFGSVIADELVVDAGGRLHFDRDSVPEREDLLPQMWSWRVLDVPTQVAGLGNNPFQLLGLDPELLPSPANAHLEQVLDVSYIDLGGTVQTYTGPESGFDWTAVSSVMSGTRDGDSFLALPAAAPEPVPEPVDPTDQALLDLIAGPASSPELYAALVAAYPVDEAVLFEAIRRAPAMTSMDLYWVLIEYGPPVQTYVGGLAAGPAPDSLLLEVLAQPAVESKQMAWLLEQNSPLSQPVLDAMLARTPALTAGDERMVLRAQ